MNLKLLMRVRIRLNSVTSLTAKKTLFKNIIWHNAASGTHTGQPCQTSPCKVEQYFSLQSTLRRTGRCVPCPARLLLIPRSGQSMEESSHRVTLPSKEHRRECKWAFHKGKSGEADKNRQSSQKGRKKIVSRSLGTQASSITVNFFLSYSPALRLKIHS